MRNLGPSSPRHGGSGANWPAANATRSAFGNFGAQTSRTVGGQSGTSVSRPRPVLAYVTSPAAAVPVIGSGPE